MRYLLLPLVLLLAGCASGAGQRSDRLISKVEAGTTDERPFQTASREYARHFMAEVIRGADRILLATDDVEISRNALLWKLNAIPAAYEAAFNVDPAAGMLDQLTFTIQMRAFFEEGNGKAVFGEHQAIAVETAQRLEAHVESVADRLVPDRPDVEERLANQWAAKHPLEDMLFLRPSTQPLVDEWVDPARRGTFAAVESMAAEMAELSYRVTVLANLLPQIGVWQAELFLLNTTGRPDATILIARIDELQDNVAKITRNVERLPETVENLAESQRKAAIEAARELIDTEVSDLMREIDKQRLEVQRFAHSERHEVFKEVERQREAMTALIDTQLERIITAIDKQRVEALEAVTAERVAALEETDAMVGRALDRFEPRLFEAVDRLAWRLAQIIGAVCVLAAVGAVLGVRLLRR